MQIWSIVNISFLRLYEHPPPLLRILFPYLLTWCVCVFTPDRYPLHSGVHAGGWVCACSVQLLLFPPPMSKLLTQIIPNWESLTVSLIKNIDSIKNRTIKVVNASKMGFGGRWESRSPSGMAVLQTFPRRSSLHTAFLPFLSHAFSSLFCPHVPFFSSFLSLFFSSKARGTLPMYNSGSRRASRFGGHTAESGLPPPKPQKADSDLLVSRVMCVQGYIWETLLARGTRGLGRFWKSSAPWGNKLK